jgi:aryl-alcohol dehydrogenase-like predicted oxidoreductase
MAPRVHLAPDYSIPRIIVGGWQFSQGHGGTRPGGESSRRFLSDLVDRGLTTFDCADIYTGVEEMLGDFLRHHRSSRPGIPVQIHTKFVPDLDVLPSIDRSYVERIIHRSLRRLGVEALDLVQFHWWDFGIPGYLEVMDWLGALRDEGKIRHLGVTNFDQIHLAELVESGAEILSNQVQYSVVDRRPEKGLATYCLSQGISLLCYGTLAGGFLTERYLGMQDPPEMLENRSLVKYKLMIDEMGGWPRFQTVLEALSVLANRLGRPLPAVALGWVLGRPAVAATITGIDTPGQAHELLGILEVGLDGEDREALDDLLSMTPMPPGPVYGLERIMDGPHGSIMRYNLNRE